jgi:hypothetical protein
MTVLRLIATPGACLAKVEILSPFCEFSRPCRHENFASVVTPIPRFVRPGFDDRSERRIASTGARRSLAPMLEGDLALRPVAAI